MVKLCLLSHSPNSVISAVILAQKSCDFIFKMVDKCCLKAKYLSKLLDFVLFTPLISEIDGSICLQDSMA